MNLFQKLFSLASMATLGCSAFGQSYKPPQSTAVVTAGIPFLNGKLVGAEFSAAFAACDQDASKAGCASDPNMNTAILRLADGTIFFDAKLAIDADGSYYSTIHSYPDQPDTSLRYSNGKSLDAEHVSYIVIPLGPFAKTLGIELGDVAAVVKDGHLSYAIFGDSGPKKRLGEGSMLLQESLGRPVCAEKDSSLRCIKTLNTSMPAPVLFFVFAGTHASFIDPKTGRLTKQISPQNINQRVQAITAQRFQSLKTLTPSSAASQ